LKQHLDPNGILGRGNVFAARERPGEPRGL
jgi:hypothetical protein